MACPSTACTTHHILWDCTGSSDERIRHLSDLDDKGLPPKVVGSWFWDRGLCPRSCFPPVPPKDNSGRWIVNYGTADMASGVVFTDGAC
eukprot:9069117-Pyramimonas_sp.AAC.1